MVRMVLILSLILVKIFAGCPDFLSESGMKSLFLYSFFHANWWHLAANCLAVWLVYNPHKKSNVRNFLTAYALSLLVFPFSRIPVIGISNIIYATIGLRTPFLTDRFWRRKESIIFLAITVAMIYVPHFSAITHILSLLMGNSLATIARAVKNFGTYEKGIR